MQCGGFSNLEVSNSASTTGARQRDATTFNQNKQIFLNTSQGLDSVLKFVVTLAFPIDTGSPLMGADAKADPLTTQCEPKMMPA